MEIDDFLKYLEFEKRYSKHTIVAYKTDLYSFNKFYTEKKDKSSIIDASAKDIRLWIVSLMKQEIAPRSINRKIVSLRIFYKYCIREQKIKLNPVDKISKLKEKKRLPAFVENQKMELLLNDIMLGNDFESKRDRLIVDFFYFTGIRLSELVNILISDINFSNNTVRIIGKRNKERLLPLHQDLIDSIKKYSIIRNEVNPTTNKLFVTTKGKEIYHKLVYRIVNKYLSLATTIEKRSPHVLRHTFATHLLNNGAELNNIKELLGHSNLAATQIYTHNSFEKLKLAYQKAHPRT